jgi:hypothetical protein
MSMKPADVQMRAAAGVQPLTSRKMSLAFRVQRLQHANKKASSPDGGGGGGGLQPFVCQDEGQR